MSAARRFASLRERVAGRILPESVRDLTRRLAALEEAVAENSRLEVTLERRLAVLEEQAARRAGQVLGPRA